MKDKIITRILKFRYNDGYRYEIQSNRVFENGKDYGYKYGLSLYDLEEIAYLRNILTSFLINEKYENKEIE
jgi:hypothetical protein